MRRAGTARSAGPALLSGALALAGLAVPAAGKHAEGARELSVSPTFQAALADAGSDDPARHARLARQLGSQAFLAQLDSRADLADATRLGLHADRVVAALAANPAPSARDAFLKLAASPTFLALDDRAAGLIRASAHVRPATPGLVKLWDGRSQPRDGFTPTVMGVLVENGSPLALKLFERKLLGRAHDIDAKTGWIRSGVTNYRNDISVLHMCERVLRGSLPARLQRELTGALFDERVPSWVLPGATTYAPPPLESASREVLGQLIKVGEVALAKARLSDEQADMVRARVAKAKKLLEP